MDYDNRIDINICHRTAEISLKLSLHCPAMRLSFKKLYLLYLAWYNFSVTARESSSWGAVWRPRERPRVIVWGPRECSQGVICLPQERSWGTCNMLTSRPLSRALLRALLRSMYHTLRAFLRSPNYTTTKTKKLKKKKYIPRECCRGCQTAPQDDPSLTRHPDSRGRK